VLQCRFLLWWSELWTFRRTSLAPSSSQMRINSDIMPPFSEQIIIHFVTPETVKSRNSWIYRYSLHSSLSVDRVWNVISHAQKTDFVFRRNGRDHLNRRGRQVSRLLVAEECASVVVMLDTPCFEAVWRVRANHTIRQFPHHFPSHASPCAITFQLDSTPLSHSWG